MALNHRYGLKLRSSSPDRLIQRLYAARRGSMDPDLEQLSLMRPMQDQVWIVRRETSTEADTQTHPESV